MVAKKSQNEPEKKRKSRGAALMLNITKSIAKGERLPIKLNSKKQPVGPNRSKLATYIGTTVKKWVPIIVDNWKLVCEDEKNAIWDDVTVSYYVFKLYFVCLCESEKNAI